MNVKNYNKFFLKEYWDTGNGAAGVLFLCETSGRVLVLKRSSYVEEPNTWGTVSGRIEDGHDSKDTVYKEMYEETGYNGDVTLINSHVYKDGDFKFYNYIGIVKNEFIPRLNWENSDYKWVELNEIPSPTHFGLEELLNKKGTQIRRLISAYKKAKMNSIQELDAAPPSVSVNYTDSIVSKEFIDYMKSVENSIKKGYDPKKKLWFPHESPEGGMPTIGYGHKIKDNAEKERANKGLTDQEVEKLLKDDIYDAYVKVVNYHNKWIIQYIKDGLDEIRKNPSTRHANFYRNLRPTDPVFRLSKKQIESLIDFTFNLGTLKTFPKFADAIFRGDWDVAKAESKRTYLNPSGERKELVARNTAFKKYFDLNEALVKILLEQAIMKLENNISTNDSEYDVDVEKIGIADQDLYRYRFISDHGYIQYLIDNVNGRNRNVKFEMIEIYPEFENQGYSKKLLNSFFKTVLKPNDFLDMGGYTNAGMFYIKDTIELLAKQYKIKLL